MSNARLDCATEGARAIVGDISNEVVVHLRNPPLSQPHSIAKEALRKTFGADVRRERTLLRISQDELAARCGLHPRTIAKIEAGEIGIRPETIDRIQRALGCTFNNSAIDKLKIREKERRQ
jgi:ribosome-binding protein aMBF1 (putative translation factor)